MVMNPSTLQGRVLKFHSTAFDPNTLYVVSLDGREAISRPYRYELELVSARADLDSAAVLQGTTWIGVKRGVELRGSDKRGVQTVKIHGAVCEFEQCERSHDVVAYRAVLVPRLWKLSLHVRSRIFLEKTVLQIAEEILKGAGFASEDYEFRTGSRSYSTREFTMQYRETDLDFFSRLLEDEGIFYFFEQGEDREKVVFGDSTSAQQPIVGVDAIGYHPEGYTGQGGGMEEWFDEEIVARFNLRHRLVPAEVVLRDYNYRTPSVDLKSSAPAARDGVGTVYEYGTHYKSAGEGAVLARIRAEEILCRERLYQGAGDVRSFRPGATFSLSNHYRADFNATFLLVEVRHKASQSISLGRRAAQPLATYENEFVCIPSDVPFRPARVTPKPRIEGTMNAVVDAAGSGDYAEIDDQGRYKVTFPLDLSGKGGGAASRYLRMAQPYAGSGMGMHFPLSKGAEVVLGFTNGDPDRPVILGAIPNAETVGPVTNSNHTQCVINSRSDNRLEFEDQKGSERIKWTTPYGNTLLQLGSRNDDNEGISAKTEKALLLASDDDWNAYSKGDLSLAGALVNCYSNSGVNLYAGVFSGIPSAMGTLISEVTKEKFGDEWSKIASTVAGGIVSAAVATLKAYLSSAGSTMVGRVANYAMDVLWPDITLLGEGGVNVLGLGPGGDVFVGSLLDQVSVFGKKGVSVVSSETVSLLAAGADGIDIRHDAKDYLRIDLTNAWLGAEQVGVFSTGQEIEINTPKLYLGRDPEKKHDLNPEPLHSGRLENLEAWTSGELKLTGGDCSISLKDGIITIEAPEGIMFKVGTFRVKATNDIFMTSDKDVQILNEADMYLHPSGKLYMIAPTISVESDVLDESKVGTIDHGDSTER